MITCPECNKLGVELIDRDEGKGTLKYQCRYCNWTEMGFVTRLNIIGRDDRNNKIILMIPESAGIGTKKLSPIGTSHHVIIDRKMMDVAGVESNDLVYVLIWKPFSKQSKEAENHE